MRRLLPAIAALLCLPAHAAGPQVTDPTGDANGTGVVAPAPASIAALDITAVRWWADSAAQRVTVTFAAAPQDVHLTLTWATPSCATNRIEWFSSFDNVLMEGCKPRHRRILKAPAVSGTSLTFSIPRRDLPTWLAAGTRLSKLGAAADVFRQVADRVLAYQEIDAAYADVPYVVGS